MTEQIEIEPCPFCRARCRLAPSTIHGFVLYCLGYGCRYRAGVRWAEAETIAEHNRISRAANPVRCSLDEIDVAAVYTAVAAIEAICVAVFTEFRHRPFITPVDQPHPDAITVRDLEEALYGRGLRHFRVEDDPSDPTCPTFCGDPGKHPPRGG